MIKIHESIASIIQQQLGRSAFSMIGTKQLIDTGNGLRIRFSASKKVNLIDIILNGRDTYDVKFMYIRGTNIRTISEFEDVYVEDLKGLIERETGLYLSL